jgi:nucleoside phosphorylase
VKILVTFAVPIEFGAWRKQRAFRQVARDPFPLYVAEIAGNTVRVVLTGIGTSMAAQSVRWALASPADLCISSGFAGALDSDARVGEILAARLVRRAETDLAVASDVELLAAARDAQARQVDRFLTSERLVGTNKEKFALIDEADAVEMESFVILAEAARRGVRALAVRAVSDTLETSLPYDFSQIIDERGSVRARQLLAAISRQPQRLPALLRLARDCRQAARQLAPFLDHYVTLVNSRLDAFPSELLATT